MKHVSALKAILRLKKIQSPLVIPPFKGLYIVSL